MSKGMKMLREAADDVMHAAAALIYFTPYIRITHRCVILIGDVTPVTSEL